MKIILIATLIVCMHRRTWLFILGTENYKNLCNQYALVFFDGPHDNDAVQREIDFFLPRTIVGSVFIFDDVWMYNHDKFHNIMLENGWEAVETGAVKISYKRVR